MTKPIFLIGMRGSGKTTLGKKLAARLNYEFIDMDLFFNQIENRTITQAVEKDGWAYFRAKESMILKQIIFKENPKKVISTGGGIILSPENRQLIRENGLCFFLSAPVSILKLRLMQSSKIENRPALTTLDLHAELALLLRERFSLYLKTSHYTINVHRSPSKVLRELVTILKKQGTNERHR